MTTRRLLQAPTGPPFAKRPAPHSWGQGCSNKGTSWADSLGPVPDTPRHGSGPALEFCVASEGGRRPRPQTGQRCRVPWSLGRKAWGKDSSELQNWTGCWLLWGEGRGRQESGSQLAVGVGVGDRQRGTKCQGPWARPVGRWCTTGVCSQEARGWGPPGARRPTSGSCVQGRGLSQPKSSGPCRYTDKLPGSAGPGLQAPQRPTNDKAPHRRGPSSQHLPQPLSLSASVSPSLCG